MSAQTRTRKDNRVKYEKNLHKKTSMCGTWTNYEGCEIVGKHSLLSYVCATGKGSLGQLTDEITIIPQERIKQMILYFHGQLMDNFVPGINKLKLI